MTIRTFWTIFIKILGLWLVLDSPAIVVQIFTAVITPALAYPETGSYITIAVCLFTLLVYAFILWLFVFKTAWLIDKLHLDKGFAEDNLALNIHHTTVLSIAIIVIGGLMLVDSLPQFCREIFNFYQTKTIFREDPETSWLILHFFKIAIGYLLLTNSKLIAAFIEKQR